MLKLKIYENYKELCRDMGWKVQSGNAKKAQLKELDTICEYHKEGNKFIIDNRIDIPQKKVDYRINSGRKALYAEQVGMAILNAVMAEAEKIKDDIVFYDKFNLILATNLANINLFDRKSVKGYKRNEVRGYKKEAKNFVYQALSAGLNWLKKSKILMFTDNVIFGRTKKYGYEEMPVKFLPTLLKIERKVLQEFCPNTPTNRRMGTIIFSDRLSEFKALVIKEFNEKFGTEYETYTSRIRFITTDLSKEWAFKLIEKSDLTIDTELWDSTHKILVKRAEKLQKKLKEKAKEKQKNYQLKKELDFRMNLDFTNNEEENNKRIQEIKNILDNSDVTENKFVDVIFTYEDYLENFEALDRIFRMPKSLK